MSCGAAGRARLASLALLAVVNGVGCSTSRPTTSHLAPSDPARALADVRAREDRITTLRARFTADTQSDGARHSAEGVLLVKKPDRFRLRLMLPFGLTIFDYVAWGQHTQVTLPTENKILMDQHDNRLAFTDEDMRQAFLRGRNTFPGTCSPNGADTSVIVVECRNAAGTLLRQIEIDSQAGTIRQETTYAEDQPRMVIRYTDYRPVADTSLPYGIAMLYPDRHISVAIAIRRYEVNPVLSDALFQPPEPWAGS